MRWKSECLGWAASLLVGVGMSGGCLTAELDVGDASSGWDGGGREDAGDGGGGPGDADAGTPDGGEPEIDAAPGDVAPTLVTASARQVGRFGHDLRIDVSGFDPNGDAASLRVTLLLSDDSEVLLYDSDGDGTFDRGEVEVPLAEALPPASEASASYVTFPRLFREYAQLAMAKLTLVDAAGQVSQTLEVGIAQQPVLGLAVLCDGAFLENRCENGLGCKGGTPKTCQEGEPPVIGRVGYFNDTLGGRILIEGTDPDDDVVAYTVEILDAQGDPVVLDLDGDDSIDDTTFTSSVDIAAANGTFFFRTEPSAEFFDKVAKIRVIVEDISGRVSAPKEASLEQAPVRASGYPCDARQFNRCVEGSVCTFSGGINYTCSSVASNQQRACDAALVLDPARGVTSVRGMVGGLSLWDAPEGCSPESQRFMPEAVVELVLDAPASKVSLSTDNAYTSLDAVLYALAACEAAPVTAWCVDASGAAEVLELTDLAAGSYFIVVDSFPSDVGGQSFQLDVSVTE